MEYKNTSDNFGIKLTNINNLILSDNRDKISVDINLEVFASKFLVTTFQRSITICFIITHYHQKCPLFSIFVSRVLSPVDGWLDNDLKCTLRGSKETRFYNVYVSSVSGLVLFILVLRKVLESILVTNLK